MGVIIRSLLLGLEGISCLLLITLVLVQKSKGGGLGGAFGGGATETLFGSRTGNVLTKATIVLSVIFMANTLVLAVLFSGGNEVSLMQRAGGTAPIMPVQQQQPQAAPVQPAIPPVAGDVAIPFENAAPAE